MKEPTDVQVARLEERVTALAEQVRELRESVEKWTVNAAKERWAILMAFLAGWLSLMVAAVTAYLHR